MSRLTEVDGGEKAGSAPATSLPAPVGGFWAAWAAAWLVPSYRPDGDWNLRKNIGIMGAKLMALRFPKPDIPDGQGHALWRCQLHLARGAKEIA